MADLSGKNPISRDSALRRGSLLRRWSLLLAGVSVLGVPASCWLLVPEKSAPPVSREPNDPLDLMARAHWVQNSETLLVVTLNRRLLFIDRRSGRAVHPFRLPQNDVSSEAVSLDGQTVIIGYRNGQVAFENRNSGSGPILNASAHAGSVVKVACSADGSRLASAGLDGSLNLWQADGNVSWQTTGWEPRINALAFSPDGLVLAAGDMAGTVRLFDVESGREELSIETRLGLVERLVFSPEGSRLYSVGMNVPNTTIACWKIPSGQPAWESPIEESGIAAIAVSPEGNRLASGGYRKELVLRDAKTGEIDRVISWFGAIRELQFSPAGPLLLITTQNEKAVHIYDLELDRIVETIPIWGDGFLEKTGGAIVRFGARLIEGARD